MMNLVSTILSRWRSVLAGAAALAIVFGALCVIPKVADAQRSVSYTFVNRTSYTIVNLYMSSSRISEWGPDRLGSRVLSPGQSWTMYGLRPGNYDIKLIDNDRDECTRMRVPVYRNTRWVITNPQLLRCEGYRR